ncbi:hypothetical protein [Bacteroides uniformis]|uniref:hypothetical protein n=1 Tax=Bacteroides uniformis TaxID=820 RepID=UPI00232A88B8|nr:hypothetical protein [Bacteroides uniformis]MDC1817268.1 hypothetical protein [Bacteroides uniformis]
MKKVKFLSLAAILALGSFVVPQTASAYKYYVTLDNGKRIMMKCDNRKDAINEFRSMNLQGHHAVLTSRPDAGIMDVK